MVRSLTHPIFHPFFIHPGTYCEICACLDPDEQLDPDHVNCVEGCDSLTFYADGFCDDENNVCGCDWDGGDWCVRPMCVNEGPPLSTTC